MIQKEAFKNRRAYKLAVLTFSLLVSETELYSDESGVTRRSATSISPASLGHSPLNLGACHLHMPTPCQGLVQGLFGLTMPGVAMPTTGSLPRR